MHEKLSRVLLFTGSIAGMVGVALGAFDAHGLRNSISSELLTTLETAVRCQTCLAFRWLQRDLRTQHTPRESAVSPCLGMSE